MSHILWLQLKKQQSELLQRFRTLQDAQKHQSRFCLGSGAELLFIWFSAVGKKVGTTHLSHRYQFAE
jgi:hypothetical protein